MLNLVLIRKTIFKLLSYIVNVHYNNYHLENFKIFIANSLLRGLYSHELLEDHGKSRTVSMLEVHECNDTEKNSKQDADVDFDPNAPYSSSMDNIPLKVLLGVPNVKMRQSPTQEKNTVKIDLSSPSVMLIHLILFELN